MAAITREASVPINRAVNFWRRPGCMLNHSSRQIERGFLPCTPVTSYTFPVPSTMFQWKDEILGPGAARFKIMTRGPATVPSGTARRGILLITNWWPSQTRKYCLPRGGGVLRGPEYISARIDRCLTGAARRECDLFFFEMCHGVEASERRLAWDTSLTWVPIIKAEQHICHIPDSSEPF